MIFDGKSSIGKPLPEKCIFLENAACNLWTNDNECHVHLVMSKCSKFH